MEIKDLVGFGGAAEKLIGEVSKGIGSLFRPRTIRAETGAEAEQIVAIEGAKSQAEANADLLKLDTKLSKIALLANGDNDLIERAKRRLLIQEIDGQKNIESIANLAIPLLAPAVSNEPLNDDWRRRFFRYAEDVCTEDMQQIWSRVLAGEISAPRSYSLRALEVLRSLGSSEAELFRKICRLAFSDGTVPIPNGDINTGLKEFGIEYREVLALRDFGLIHEGDMISITLQNDSLNHVSFYNGVLVEISSELPLRGKSYNVIIFTAAGRELMKLMSNDPQDGYLKSLSYTFLSKGMKLKKGIVGLPDKNGASLVEFVDI
jgi:Protein of unknown function (DUF2806)